MPKRMSFVISGASSGIGRAAALAFAARGASVTLASLHGGRLAEVARDCTAAGRRVQYVGSGVALALGAVAPAAGAVLRERR